jgi:PiT family inorganic phosphate transporter
MMLSLVVSHGVFRHSGDPAGNERLLSDMTLVFCVIIVALIFEYVNGFHDTANAIATSIATRVLSPRQAIIIATTFDLLGALSGHAVALTIGKGLVDIHYITQETIMCGLIAGILWNLLTWYVGLPSSSSHALIGGLCGAALAVSHSNWGVIHWCVEEGGRVTGLWPQVIKPLFLAPIIGLIAGFVFMGLLMLIFRPFKPAGINRNFGKLQILSSAWISFSHGTNDAQKTMGIITLSLVTATTAGTFDNLPHWLDFLKLNEFAVPTWLTWVCAITLASGIATGGWRIIKTVGSKLVRMNPMNGFAAQSMAALVIHVASHWGIPLSTTHVTSTSIMGVGATKRFNAVKWSVAGSMIWAWVLTLPITCLIGFFTFKIVQIIFGI